MSLAKFRKARFNPFDKTVLGAKIPDAKSTVSNALRFQSVLEYTVPPPSGGATSNEPVLCFFPGFNNTFSILKPDETYDAGGHYAAMPSITVDDQGSAGTGSSTPLEKWRIVSAGLRLQLINNADENDGWFEAIRVEPGWDQNDLTGFKMIAAPTGTIVRTPIAFAPTTLTARRSIVPAKGSWANHPTYVTGKLRDIHQYMWKLNSTAKDHDYTNSTNASLGGFENIDKNYDVILIRLHGRTAAEQSKVVIHQCTNYEIVFEAGTLMSTVATATAGSTLAAVGDSVRPSRPYSNRYFGYTGRMRTYGTYKRRYARMYTRKKRAPTKKRYTRVYRRKK